MIESCFPCFPVGGGTRIGMPFELGSETEMDSFVADMKCKKRIGIYEATVHMRVRSQSEYAEAAPAYFPTRCMAGGMPCTSWQAKTVYASIGTTSCKIEYLRMQGLLLRLDVHNGYEWAASPPGCLFTKMLGMPGDLREAKNNRTHCEKAIRIFIRWNTRNGQAIDERPLRQVS